MPNWCSTTIYFRGENASKLQKMIEDWSSKSYCENGFDRDDHRCWLGNIVGNSGIDDRDNGDFKTFCRGWISDIDGNGNELTVYEESAWEPAISMWEKINDKFNLNLDITYYAEEPGCEVYLTNDSSYEEKYIVDCPEQSLIEMGFPDYESEMSEKSVIELLKKVLKTGVNDIKKLLNLLCETDLECYIHKWDIAEVSELS